MERQPGSFEILAVHARGAYGTLCVARRLDDPLQRIVALKVLKGSLSGNPRVLTRARDEARMLSRLKHPNIVYVEELLSVARRPVMVMEWVEGLSLRRLLDHHRDGLPVAVTLEVIRRSARALDDAFHGSASQDGRSLQIIHRDIKPDNILLSVHGEVKLVDFGVARASFVERETTTVSTILGSQGYMAPERASGSEDSPAVDVYSLGVTALELLTGRLPVLVRDPDEHRRLIERGLQHMRLPEASVHLWDEVAALLRAMTAYQPDQRPSSREVVDRIRVIQATGALPVSLDGYALEVVAPLYRNRPQMPPEEHPAWDDVRFLADADAVPPPTDTHTPAPASPAELRDTADRRVRRFLASSGWEKRKRELKWLLALHPEWTAAPFVDVLASVDRPFWKLWRRRANAGQLAVALELLRHRPTPDVVARARDFVDHPAEDVAAAARILVGPDL